MTKSELVDCLAELFPQLKFKDINYAVNMILEVMCQALACGHRIEIRGFGTFSLKLRSSRIGYNPKSREKVWITQKLLPHFKPSKKMLKCIAKY